MINVFGSFFLLLIVIEFALFFVCVGVCGFLTSVERGIGPETMLFITRIGSQTNEISNKRDKKLNFRYLTLRWRFNVPKNFNSKDLRIKQITHFKEFPWRLFWFAMFWEVIFGAMISINLSLNSLLMTSVSLEELFAVASFSGAFMLIFIFPFLIYNRIDARIVRQGNQKDFKLEHGLRNRTLQIFALVATLSLIFHLVIGDITILSVLVSFIFFNIVFFIVAIIITYLYYDTFEDDLARDIVKRYKKVKD